MGTWCLESSVSSRSPTNPVSCMSLFGGAARAAALAAGRRVIANAAALLAARDKYVQIGTCRRRPINSGFTDPHPLRLPSCGDKVSLPRSNAVWGVVMYCNCQNCNQAHRAYGSRSTPLHRGRTGRQYFSSGSCGRSAHSTSQTTESSRARVVSGMASVPSWVAVLGGRRL